MHISLLTQVKIILIENNNITSSIVTYQVPKNILKPTVIVEPQCWENNYQKIILKSNRNSTIYYEFKYSLQDKNNNYTFSYFLLL